MAEANIYLTLDTVLPNRERVFYGVSGDYGTRFIVAKITAAGKPLIIDGEIVTINFHRPDNAKASFSGHLNEDGTVTVPVVQWALDIPGEVKSSISCTTKSGRLTTTEFYIMAKATLWNGGNTSPDTPEIPEGVYIGIASITQSVKSDESGGANIWTVELTDGTKTDFIVKNGENGATFTPAVSSDGTISWTNDKGLDNPESVNIKGEKGDPFRFAKVFHSYSKMQDGVLTDGVEVGEYVIIDASDASDEDTKLRHGWIFIKTPRFYKHITNIAGPQGLQGDKGDTGEKGEQGEQGEQGLQGEKGADGVDGERGTGILKVSSALTSYTTAIGGKNPIKRMKLSTIKSEAGVDVVLVGDTISYSYYLYHIYYVDATYAYADTYTSIRGATGSEGANGTSVTVSSVTESTESGGENVVTFSDGKTLKVKNGKDYILTETDEANIAAKVVELLGGNPVYAVIDENNIVTIKGLSENESYTFKLEMEDGSTVDVGEFEPIEPIENQLPISTDASGNLYVGDNGEKGYKTNHKISTSSGVESATSYSACVSGFIKLADGVQSEILIENITVAAQTTTNNLVFYNANKERMNGYPGPAGAFNSEVKVTDGVYQILTKWWFTNDNTPAYFRFSCGEITDETIVTVSEWIG